MSFLHYLRRLESLLIIIIINNNNLHLYSANLYMNIFGCALHYCYIKVMLKVTKASGETIKIYNKKYLRLKIYLKAKLKK